LKTKLVED